MDRETSLHIKRLDLKGVHKALKTIGDQYESVIDENQALREQLAKFNEADAIMKQKKIAEDIRRHSLLILTDKELSASRQFQEEHRTSCGNLSKFYFGITWTSVGRGVDILCPICGKEKDITDYEAW